MNVIIKPVFTEKSMKDAAVGVYTFLVANDADKPAIKSAVERLFNVSVKRVSTNHVKKMKTRVVRRGKQISDLSYKKARITVLAGQKIDIFEETEEKKKEA